MRRTQCKPYSPKPLSSLLTLLQSIISLDTFDAKDYTSRVMSVVKDLVANAGTKAPVVDDAFRIAASLAEGE